MVNLLNARAKELKKRKLMFMRVQMYAGGILVVYLAILFSMLAVRGIFALRLKQTQDAIQKEELRLTQLRPIEAKYTLLGDWLALITDFKEMMVDSRALLESLRPIMPETVEVTSLDYGEGSKSVNLAVSSVSYPEIESWLKELNTQVQNKNLGGVTVSGLTRDDLGAYQVEATIEFSELRDKDENPE